VLQGVQCPSNAAPKPGKAEGTMTGHQNGEAMASVGVRFAHTLLAFRVVFMGFASSSSRLAAPP
jgi:hypothetical protein